MDSGGIATAKKVSWLMNLKAFPLFGEWGKVQRGNLLNLMLFHACWDAFPQWPSRSSINDRFYTGLVMANQGVSGVGFYQGYIKVWGLLPQVQK